MRLRYKCKQNNLGFPFRAEFAFFNPSSIYEQVGNFNDWFFNSTQYSASKIHVVLFYCSISKYVMPKAHNDKDSTASPLKMDSYTSFKTKREYK